MLLESQQKSLAREEANATAAHVVLGGLSGAWEKEISKQKCKYERTQNSPKGMFCGCFSMYSFLVQKNQLFIFL